MSVGALEVITNLRLRGMGFFCDEQGTETLEWGLVCGFLIVGALATLAFVGPKVNGLLSDLNNTIPPSAP
jgi:Flp pilus assembly pilin Flp